MIYLMEEKEAQIKKRLSVREIELTLSWVVSARLALQTRDVSGAVACLDHAADMLVDCKK